MSNSADLGKIAVLFGGNSAEREVSLASGQAVLGALQQQGLDAHAFDPAQQPLVALLEQGFDRVFIALHGRGGEDGSLQGALEQLGLPYTGSGVAASALGMDKVRTKYLWRGMGLPTADFVAVTRASLASQDSGDLVERLGLPLIVKPALEGSSIGISKVSCADELDAALEAALAHDSSVLVEQWISGGEYTVAILGEDRELKPLPAIRMETPNTFYDYEAKYQSDTTNYYCPCGLSEPEEAELAKLATEAFAAVGCSGWGRVDVMRDAAGNWMLLEVNTVPGMTETSLVPKAAGAAGISFQALVRQLLEQTAEQASAS